VTDRSTWRGLSAPRRATVLALLRRDYAITRSYRLAFASDLVLGAVNLAVFFFISETFSNASTAALQGAPSYFAFAAVGVAITVVIQGASIGLAQRVREEQLTGTLEALVVQPVSAAELSLGLAGFPFLFATARAVLYLALAAPWLDLGSAATSWPGVAVMFLATAGAVTSIGVALGAMVLIFKRSEGLVVLVTFALGALGGALFPVSVLPPFVESLTHLVPTRPAFDGVRAALFRGDEWVGNALALAAFTAVALPAAIWVFSGALALTRRRGSISQY
jgi:ABC-2 type transport system permease protein